MTLALHRPFMFSVEALLSRGSTGGSEDVFFNEALAGPGARKCVSQRSGLRRALEKVPCPNFLRQEGSPQEFLICHTMPYHAIPYHAMPLSGAESHARF